MPNYLLQISYTPEAWTALLKNPVDRKAAISDAIAKLGGTMDHAWFAFGDYDIIGVLSMPSNVSAAALSFAISAGGACKTVKTTPLLSIEDGMEALKAAAACGYKAVTANA